MTTSIPCRVLVASLLCAAACRGAAVEDVESTAAVPVKIVVASPHEVEGIVAATGIVTPEPGADSTITAPQSARIAALPRAEGDRVRRGDILVRFEIPSLASDVAAREAEVQQAQARLDNASASVERLSTLVQHGVAAQKDLEDAQRERKEAAAALTQARSATASAQSLASRAVVRARFDGVVAKRSHNPGDMVEPTDPILRVLDPARLQVVASVSIADLSRIETGQQARVAMPGGGPPAAAHVLTRPAAVEPGGATADVRIAFDSRTRLAAGTPVQVEIVAERHTGALGVPATAIVREGDAAYAFVAGADGKAHRRAIELGLTTPGEVEILRGVKAGDKVIVEGQHGLPDGAVVTITP